MKTPLAILILLLSVILSTDAPLHAEEGTLILSMAWSPDGTLIAMGDDEGMINIVSTVDGTTIHSFQAHNARVTATAWNLESTQLVSGGRDLRMKVWDLSSFNAVSFLEINDFQSMVTSVAWLPNDQIWVADLEGNPNFRVVDLAGAMLFSERTGSISDLAISPSGNLVARGYAYPLADIVLAESFLTHGYIGPDAEHIDQEYERSGELAVLAWDSSETQVVAGSMNKTISLWDIVENRKLLEVNGTDSLGDDYYLTVIWEVWFSPDDHIFAGIAGDGTLRFWEVPTGQLLSEMQLEPISAATVSPDGLQLAIGTRTGSFQILPIEYPPTETP